MISYIVVLEATLDSLKSGEPLAGLYQAGSVTDGYWKAPLSYITISVLGTQEQIDELADYLGAGNIYAQWYWNFDGTVDFETEYEGQQNDILALQEDHVTYDENGNETSRTPATFENPNWAHAYYGQGDNEQIQRFAREYSREFSEEFK